MRRPARVLTLLIAAGLLAGCVTSSGSDGPTGSTVTTDEPADAAFDPATTAVELTFRDSSVPPEYHRSYVMTLTADEVHVVVDSYGDVIHDVTEPMPEEAWDQFVADLPDELDGLPEPAEDDGCAGGTGTALKVTVGDETVFDERDDSCQQDFQAAAQDLLITFAELVDLDTLRDTD